MQNGEVLKKLILANYIDMFKRKDKSAIKDFINNSKSIDSFLYALGASREMLTMPAHREELENCLKSIVVSTLSAVSDGETDLEVKYLENGLKTNIETLKYCEKYSLEFCKDRYTFEVRRNIGETNKNKVIKRIEMQNFIDDEKKGIDWNGNPFELNEQPASVDDFRINMCNTILKYPQTEIYYENIVGKDIVSKAIKCLSGKGENL